MSSDVSSMGALGAIHAGLGVRSVFARPGVNETDRALMRIPAILGAGHTGRLLRDALADALTDALTDVQAEDLIIHLASYTGIARAYDAMLVLQATLKDLGREHDVATSADEWADKSLDERFAYGLRQYARLDAQRADQQVDFYAALSPDYYRHAMGMFGCTFSRPSLDIRAREIATVAFLAAMGTAPSQLAFHVRVALEQGVAKELLPEVLLHVQLFAGLPTANNAATLMREMLAPAPA